jgi:hypothetical protein
MKVTKISLAILRTMTFGILPGNSGEYSCLSFNLGVHCRKMKCMVKAQVLNSCEVLESEEQSSPLRSDAARCSVAFMNKVGLPIVMTPLLLCCTSSLDVVVDSVPQGAAVLLSSQNVGTTPLQVSGWTLQGPERDNAHVKLMQGDQSTSCVLRIWDGGFYSGYTNRILWVESLDGGAWLLGDEPNQALGVLPRSGSYLVVYDIGGVFGDSPGIRDSDGVVRVDTTSQTVVCSPLSGIYSVKAGMSSTFVCCRCSAQILAPESYCIAITTENSVQGKPSEISVSTESGQFQSGILFNGVKRDSESGRWTPVGGKCDVEFMRSRNEMCVIHMSNIAADGVIVHVRVTRSAQ